MLRRTCGVSLYAFKRLLGESRFYFAFLLTAITVHFFSDAVVRLCHDVGVGCSPAELFALITSDHWANALFYLIWILLICAQPFINEDTPLLVLRSKRSAWCAGQMGFILLTSLIYWLIIGGLCALFLSGFWQWNDEWSPAIMTLAYTTASTDYSLNFVISLKITALYGVWKAALFGFSLHMLTSMLMGLLALYLGSIWGILFPLAFILLDISFYGLGLPKFMYFFSPVSLSDLSVLDPTKSDYLPSISYAFISLGVTILFLMILSLIKSRRRDFTRNTLELL